MLWRDTTEYFLTDCSLYSLCVSIIITTTTTTTIIIIMYIYHALINALSTHMININLNTIFYTHVEQSYQNNLHKVLFGNTHTHMTVAETGY